LKLKFYIFILLPFFISSHSLSQGISRIQLVGADAIEFDENLGNGARRLIGNVRFSQDDVFMTCDSAYFYPGQNIFDAYSKVHVERDSSLDIYSTFLHYTGNDKIAQFRNKVVLTDQDLTLKTNHMDYDLNDNSGRYFNYGIIIDSASTLESDWGFYIPNKKQLLFKDSVRVKNEKYTIFTDTIKYNTQTEVVYFFGPTRIVSDTNLLYCENGWYNTRTDIAQFNKDAYYKNKVQKLSGDSLYYDRNRGIGKAFSNVTIVDTVENIMLKGNLGVYYENPERSLITDNALFIQYADEDTLFLHADTLHSQYDTSGIYRILNAFHKVKMYREDFQSKCDSLIYSLVDSVIKLYDDPILWAQGNQITADVIYANTIDNKLDNFELKKKSFVISQEDSIRYNQIKGKNMFGYIRNNEIKNIKVRENGETLYFAKDEGGLVGINRATCDSMNIYLKNKEVNKIVFLTNPTATLFPLDELGPKEIYLKNFIWLEDQRPKKPDDVLLWE
jgi:lipopolysaccharide export system protein LptA